MAYYDYPLRAIAKAAKLRDWGTIDDVLDDQVIQGRLSVIMGRTDALVHFGNESLPPLSKPDPVLLSDLPLVDGFRITPEGKSAAQDTSQWATKWK